jgi:hypothetical protein
VVWVRSNGLNLTCDSIVFPLHFFRYLHSIRHSNRIGFKNVRLVAISYVFYCKILTGFVASDFFVKKEEACFLFLSFVYSSL